MPLHVTTPSYQLFLGDSLKELTKLPENSVDSIVCDPPYELGFMNKGWDKSGIANSVQLWREALRVLKPGGHLLAFSGSRTYHRMACAIEDAGFEIRDQIMWVYGSGFPKSMDVSKAINKMQTGGAYSTDHAKQWEGWGTALKPAHEPICLARKPFKGTVARNVLSWGTGAINIQGCKVNASPNNEGRWPANFAHDGSEEVLATFPEAKGQQGALTGNEPSAKMGAANCYSPMSRRHSSTPREEGDKSAARFFYCAKASPSDRHEGLVNPGPQFKHGATLRSVENTNTTGNNHPTVKPTKLMQWLCRLVTPPGGTVLDLFMGSGSTGKACMIEGFNFIGIELNPDYMAIATARIMHANKEPRSAEIA